MSYIELSPSVAGGTGDVVGPASSVASRIASFSGTTGKLIQDSGVLSTSVVQGPASSVADRVATYSDTTGKLIKDSGTLISSLATTAQAVRYDAVQSLTAAQATQARANIAAAPLDALAYNGMQVNGSMEVSQENGGTAIAFINNAKHVIDGWLLASVGSQNVTGVQAPVGPAGYTKALQVYATVANASPAAGDYAIYVHNIEGYRVSRLALGTVNAQTFTISFWANSTATGTYSGAVRNGAANRSYAFTYAISAVNTWEYKTITVPGDTTGTWAKDNTIGMALVFAALAGTTFQTAPGTWTAGSFFGASGAFNLLKNTTDTLLITGVVVLPGNEAPSAARSALIMRPYDQELLACQRYWYKQSTQIVSGYNGAGGGIYNTYEFAVQMRATPTLTFGSPSGNNAQNIAAMTLTSSFLRASAAIIATGGGYVTFDFTADARL